MEIEKRFEVRAAPDDVWDFLTDPHRVAACLPGAKLTDQVEDTYRGTITVKVGPVASSYKGKMKFASLEPDLREAVIEASGQDIRGKGGADLRMKSHVIARDDGVTEVVVTSETKVTGLLAQLGRGMIVEVSDRLFDRFAAAMREQLETPENDAQHVAAGPAASPGGVEEGAESIDVLSLGAQALVRRPGFWIAAAVLAAIVIWLSFG
jgi:carbon monoxide dehydrogenase subunit G